jgi:hypothetical protein
MTDFGEAKFILGMNIVRNKEAGTISLSQEQYTKEILEKVRHVGQRTLQHTHGSHALPRRRGRIRPKQNGHVTTGTRDFPEHETFRVILESANFLCMCTRPDIAFAMIVISRRQTTPTQLHMKQLKRLPCYHNGKKPMGITYYGRTPQDNADDIKVFSDSEWAADATTRRSQS